jgi:hypothetical protein
MQKLVYCWCTIPPEFLHECSARFHDNIKDALRQIIVGDGPHFGEFQTHLSSLPVSLGGLGIHSPSQILTVAYPASFLSTLQLQTRILRLANAPIQSHIPQSVIEHVQRFADMVRSQPNDRLELVSNILARGTQPFEDIPFPSVIYNFIWRGMFSKTSVLN